MAVIVPAIERPRYRLASAVANIYLTDVEVFHRKEKGEDKVKTCASAESCQSDSLHETPNDSVSSSHP